MKRAVRAADPYRDTVVIDSRAPRVNQAVVGAVSALAVATGWWWLLAVLAAQLVVGLRLGRRFCLPCLLYFELIQPLAGEGPLEDARPPRFANMVGVVFLGTASVAYWLGTDTAGAVLGGVVAALALLAAATGFCAGCEAYDGPPLHLVPAAAASSGGGRPHDGVVDAGRGRRRRGVRAPFVTSNRLLLASQEHAEERRSRLSEPISELHSDDPELATDCYLEFTAQLEA